MDIAEIAKYIAIDLQNTGHSYKNEKVRFRNMCIRKWRIYKETISENIKTFDVFFQRIKENLQPKELVRQEKQRVIPPSLFPDVPTEGDGALFTLNQIKKENLNEDPYF